MQVTLLEVPSMPQGYMPETKKRLHIVFLQALIFTVFADLCLLQSAAPEGVLLLPKQ